MHCMYSERAMRLIRDQMWRNFTQKSVSYQWRIIYYHTRPFASAGLDQSRSQIAYNAPMWTVGALPIGCVPRPIPINSKDRDLIRPIDDVHLQYSFYSSRKIHHELLRWCSDIERDQVFCLMRRIGERHRSQTIIPDHEKSLSPVAALYSKVCPSPWQNRSDDLQFHAVVSRYLRANLLKGWAGMGSLQHGLLRS